MLASSLTIDLFDHKKTKYIFQLIPFKYFVGSVPNLL